MLKKLSFPALVVLFISALLIASASAEIDQRTKIRLLSAQSTSTETVVFSHNFNNSYSMNFLVVL